MSVSRLYASFDVDEQTYLKYISNQRNSAQVPVYMGLANETGFTREGTINSIDNNLNTTSGTIRVRATFDNPNGVLLPGLYARIRLGGGQPRPAILISPTAVGVDQDKRFVVVVDAKNQTAYREVKLGAQQDGLQIVNSGLQAGDRIVVNGLQRIRPVTLLHRISSLCQIHKSLLALLLLNLSQQIKHQLRQKVNHI